MNAVVLLIVALCVFTLAYRYYRFFIRDGIRYLTILTNHSTSRITRNIYPEFIRKFRESIANYYETS